MVGVEQRVTFDQGLATSVAWFRENLQTWWGPQKV